METAKVPTQLFETECEPEPFMCVVQMHNCTLESMPWQHKKITTAQWKDTATLCKHNVNYVFTLP